METRLLPVPLGDAEIALKADNLAARIKELQELEAEKKSATASFNERTKTLEKEVYALAQMVRDKAEDREVEVREVRNEERFTIDTARVDSGEIVESRPMSSTERTRPMFPGGRVN